MSKNDRFWDPQTCKESKLKFLFEDEMMRLAEERDAQFRSVAPHKKKPVVCLHWLRGLCHRNEITCDSLHVYEPSLFPVCHFFNKEEGRCNNPDCIFRHPSSIEGDLICVAYARGFCEHGEKCPHRHIKRRAEELERRNEFVREAKDSHRRIEQRAQRFQPIEQRNKRQLRHQSQEQRRERGAKSVARRKRRRN